MSLRRLYRAVPVAERLCSYYRCGRPIRRNLDRSKDDRLWHHGCLEAALDESWRCRNCYTTFNALEAVFAEAQIIKGDEMHTVLHPECPHCGSQDLKPSTFLEAAS